MQNNSSDMPPPPSEQPRNHREIRRLVNALICSLNGLRSCFRHETAFRQEVLLFIIFIPLGIWIGQDITEKILLCSVVSLVLIVELINTAIECAIDRASIEPHELSRRAKDAGSAAVFLTLVLACAVWIGLVIF